jgi:hypothetical protein
MGTATAVTVASDALLLGAIVVAPWMITALRSADATRLEILIAAGIIAWIGTLVLEARLPRVPPVLALMVVALITYGALLVVNARGQYESATQTIAKRPQLVSWVPGAVDRATALRAFGPLGVALLATLGLIGAALWSAVLAWPLACGLRSLRDRMRGGEPLPAVTLAGLLALGALLVHSLVDFPLQIFAIELTAGRGPRS